MRSLGTLILCLVASLGFIAPATAASSPVMEPVAAAHGGPGGQIEVPAGALTAGSEITVGYTNPNKAGQTIEVMLVDDWGDYRGSLFIDLDAQGHGSTNWTVPSWGGVLFTADGAMDIAKLIL